MQADCVQCHSLYTGLKLTLHAQWLSDGDYLKNTRRPQGDRTVSSRLGPNSATHNFLRVSSRDCLLLIIHVYRVDDY